MRVLTYVKYCYDTLKKVGNHAPFAECLRLYVEVNINFKEQYEYGLGHFQNNLF